MPRHLLTLIALIAFAVAAPLAEAEQKPDLVTSILRDPAAPVGGNPNGDITIVAFLDYNCPYCRRATPDLDKFVASDRAREADLQGLADPRTILGHCGESRARGELSGQISASA